MAERVVERVQRVLNQQRVSMMHILPGDFVRDTASFECMKEVYTDMIMTRLTAFVLTEQLVDERQLVDMAVPATWWQHFKRDNMPRWFTSRCPVRYEIFTKDVTFNVKATYPSSNYALPEDKFGKPVIFEEFHQTPWWIDDRRQ